MFAVVVERVVYPRPRRLHKVLVLIGVRMLGNVRLADVSIQEQEDAESLVIFVVVVEEVVDRLLFRLIRPCRHKVVQLHIFAPFPGLILPAKSIVLLVVCGLKIVVKGLVPTMFVVLKNALTQA